MATDHNFRIKNGLEVGGQEVISSSGVVTSAALGGQTLSSTDSPTFDNLTLTGSLRGPATMTIDPAAVGDNTGTLVIAGNLQVDGTTTTINSTSLSVDDLNITLASGAANAAAADGAGLTVDGASATLTYDSTNDRWAFNKGIAIPCDSDVEIELTGSAAGNIRANQQLYLLSQNSSLYLGSNGTNAIVNVNSNGYVGVGMSTDTPNAQLHVYSTPAEGFRLEGNDEYVYNSYYGTVSSTETRLGYIGFANQTGTATDFNFVNDQSGRFTFDTLGNTRFQVEGGTVRSNEKLLINADAGNEQFVIRRSSATNEQLILGVHSSDYATIQSVEQGVSWNPIALNPNGGNIGIGTVAPQSEFAINFGSGRNTSPPTTNIHQSNFSVLKNDGSSGGDYGYQLGVKNSGDVWSQVGRTDDSGTSTWYHQILQPSGGNVVIGRDGTPVAKLEVSGQLYAGPVGTGDATTKALMDTYSVLKLKPHDQNSTNMTFASVSGGDGIGIQVSNGPQTANWHIALNPFGGYVGIGTDSPGVELDIKRSANSYPLRIGSSQGEGRAIVFADINSSPTKYNFIAGTQYNVNDAFEITPSTAVGGYTFNAPAFAVRHDGKITIGNYSGTPETQLNIAHDGHGLGIGYEADLKRQAGMYTSSAAHVQTAYGDLILKARTDYGGFYGIGLFTASSNDTPTRRFTIQANGVAVSNHGQIGFINDTNFINVDQATATRMRFALNGYNAGEIKRIGSSAGGSFRPDQYSTGTTAESYPAFAEYSDENTGIAFPGADQVSIVTGGSKRISVVNTNVGIGSSGSVLLNTRKFNVISDGLNNDGVHVGNYNGANTYMCAAHYMTGAGSTLYHNIKTNISCANENVMYRVHVTGYNYGTSHAIDLHAWGYAYSAGNTHAGVGTQNQGTDSAQSIEIYKSSDNFSCIKIYLGASSYYAGFVYHFEFAQPTGYNKDFEITSATFTSSSSNQY
jgi:lipopolysaccharide export system protein LptA